MCAVLTQPFSSKIQMSTTANDRACKSAQSWTNSTYFQSSHILSQTSFLIFMFEFPCIISLYYMKNQQDATLAALFISKCKS
jgi:hypothetical protein